MRAGNVLAIALVAALVEQVVHEAGHGVAAVLSGRGGTG
jgi:hypothetical protein